MSIKKGFIPLFIAAFSFYSSAGQNNNNKLGITPYLRWDSYPDFNYATNPTTINNLKMKGTSVGLDFAYNFFIAKGWYLKTGIGYYRYSFTKMKQINSVFGESKSRIVDSYVPPGPIVPALTYSTNKYWYNSFVLSVGIQKEFKLKRDYTFSVGGGLSNYFTYSQLYYITVGLNGPGRTNYRKHDFRYFGYSFYFTSSLEKNIGKINIGPAILFPVYDYWKQDKN